MSVFHRARMRPSGGTAPSSVGRAGCDADALGGSGRLLPVRMRTRPTLPWSTAIRPPARARRPPPTPESAATISANLPDGGTVSVGQHRRADRHRRHLRRPSRSPSARGAVSWPAPSSDDQTTWTATERLEPGPPVQGPRHRRRRRRTRRPSDTRVFRTDPLTLDQQTYPSIAPLAGETVGVGMPVIVQFDVGVTDKASIEKHLKVKSSPKQAGAWHWISDNEVHWRPRALLAARHPGQRRRRHQRHPGRQRHLRPAGAAAPASRSATPVSAASTSRPHTMKVVPQRQPPAHDPDHHR